MSALRKQAELNEWICDELSADETLTIEYENFTATLTLANIYEDVNFNAQSIKN
jgi:hypothetical protein